MKAFGFGCSNDHCTGETGWIQVKNGSRQDPYGITRNYIERRGVRVKIEP
tara:strand:+ start:1152 stop:1301 length:150 start_codon:yes stop_codon:yes gene_type:complete